MKSVGIIALNTFREIIRDRILYGIVVFALLLIGVSIALGQLSFSEQARISANFGFMGIQIGAVILAIFVGSTLVAREIEKQTILTLLARPISRSQFLMGKFFGLLLVILTVMVGLAVVLGLLISFLDLPVTSAFFAALFGVVLEGAILLALSIFFGSFSRPIMTVIFTSCFFLLGHWVGSLKFFIEKSQSDAFKFVGKVLVYTLPDLEKFNWRSAPVYNQTVSMETLAQAGLYGVGWTMALIALTVWIFRRRDFV